MLLGGYLLGPQYTPELTRYFQCTATARIFRNSNPCQFQHFGNTTYRPTSISFLNVVAFYGASVTIADLIMKDGKSLEKSGVTPDEKMIPTAKDIAEQRDVVLSKAVESLGFKLTPEEAGKIFPNEYDR